VPASPHSECVCVCIYIYTQFNHFYTHPVYNLNFNIYSITIPKHFSLYLNTLNATHPLFSQLYLISIETTSCWMTKYLHPILTRPTPKRGRDGNKSHDPISPYLLAMLKCMYIVANAIMCLLRFVHWPVWSKAGKQRATSTIIKRLLECRKYP